MRSRMIREGSVGLLFLLGFGLFGLLVLWLRGFNPNNRSYGAIIEFADVGGMQVGAPVRYRGVVVGRTEEIRPSLGKVEVEVKITPATVKIPSDAVIQVNQSGLIGETTIDIFPSMNVENVEVAVSPLSRDCPNSGIVCDGDRLQGVVGVSFNELISATVRLTNLITDPGFFSELRTLTRNSADAAAGVAGLSREFTRLTRSFDRELVAVSRSANATTRSFGAAAEQLSLTAGQVNALLSENRGSLATTLDNIDQTSSTLRSTMTQLSDVLDGEGELVQNLEALSANAVEASDNLRNLTGAVGSSENVVLLQQTLESARATFQNAQKITADLDELTGDPAFRSNVRDLVNGLSGLVSLSEQLQQQTAIAQELQLTREELATASQTEPNALPELPRRVSELPQDEPLPGDRNPFVVPRDSEIKALPESSDR
jgi:phospholipid/cholesterol/gamma-HCH transport system substrate-binding protein